TKYTAAEGLPALRQAVAKCYLERTGLQYGMDQVLISNGAKHSLHNALSTLVGPGDEVIIPSPYWTSYADLVGMTGASLKLVPTSAEQGFKLTPAQLQQAISSKSKVLLMNSPCNPTGVTYTSEELTSLARVVTAKKIAVLWATFKANRQVVPTVSVNMRPW
ncbi:MAG TPA: aminotransferase class I/II-fold pyridoxal phosphate-dependent enzyme, partial [Gemmatales bacterium]|nr:aminotransferase class I/II-fold pyridoxal phosphate-dependent enzyme [Gemmatales bacterium]